MEKSARALAPVQRKDAVSKADVGAARSGIHAPAVSSESTEHFRNVLKNSNNTELKKSSSGRPSSTQQDAGGQGPTPGEPDPVAQRVGGRFGWEAPLTQDKRAGVPAGPIAPAPSIPSAEQRADLVWNTVAQDYAKLAQDHVNHDIGTERSNMLVADQGSAGLNRDNPRARLNAKNLIGSSAPGAQIATADQMERIAQSDHDAYFQSFNEHGPEYQIAQGSLGRALDDYHQDVENALSDLHIHR